MDAKAVRNLETFPPVSAHSDTGRFSHHNGRLSCDTERSAHPAPSDALFPPPNHVQTLPCSSPVPQHHFPRDGDREDAIFAMIPPRKLKISPRRGSWTGNGALEAVDGVQGRLTAPWRCQRPATHVACPVAGLAGLYDRTAAENKGWHGIVSPHGLDGRGSQLQRRS